MTGADRTTHCVNHPDRPAVAVCKQHRVGYCAECLECRSLGEKCKYRSECVIYMELYGE